MGPSFIEARRGAHIAGRHGLTAPPHDASITYMLFIVTGDYYAGHDGGKISGHHRRRHAFDIARLSFRRSRFYGAPHIIAADCRLFSTAV